MRNVSVAAVVVVFQIICSSFGICFFSLNCLGRSVGGGGVKLSPDKDMTQNNKKVPANHLECLGDKYQLATIIVSLIS